MIFFEQYFSDTFSCINQVDYGQLKNIGELIKGVHQRGGKVILVGNGGSAAIAAHVSVDLTKAAGIRSICFNESSLLTCFANDYGYENWVQEAVKSYADPSDLIILISSSGQSKNIINGAIQAKKMGIELVTLSGFSRANPLAKLGLVNLWANSDKYNYIENAHQVWLLSVVDCIVQSRR